MAKYHDGFEQKSKNIPLSPSKESNQETADIEQTHEIDGLEIHEDRLAHISGNMLDKADTYIYTIVGACFLLAALFALIYTFWIFGFSVLVDLPQHAAKEQPAIAAQAIISFISGLLLVLIITEVLATVIHYLKSHQVSLRPFLFIGIISATRSILSIGARLSVGAEATEAAFNHAMIELGVSAAVILALGITLKLLGKQLETDSSGV